MSAAAASLVLATAGGPREARTPRDGAAAVFSGGDSAGFTDPRRFAALVSRYQSRVYRLVAGILGPAHRAEAEDATQEVFLHAYSRLATFRGDSRLSTWLYRLAYNRAIDYRRRLDRRREDPEPEIERPSAGGPAATPLGRALAGERADRLQREIERLKPRQRVAVHLHYWLGCSIAEIAELTDARPSTVKSHLFRARRALARALAEEER